jgi:thiol-disulfide isomerase/thioredoxin
MTMRDILPQTDRARELLGDFWFNSDPVPLAALRGQVILLEFWDCTSAACVRTFPYVIEWRRRYKNSGLVVVGVHTPRFSFGKHPEHVQGAIARLGIDFPVVMDNESLIASNYGCRSIPELVFIDKDGFIRYRSAGEGNYGAIEHSLQALLYNAGVSEELPMVMEPLRNADSAGAVCYRATPELHAGYLRGSLGNVEGYSPESVVGYNDPGIYLDGRFYADGEWMNGRDFFRLERSNGKEGHIIVPYQGLDVDSVLAPEGAKQVEITVRQDDGYLSAANRGDDVRIDAKGRSFIVVDEPRLYNLVRNREYGEHVLKLGGGNKRFSLYTVSFSTAVIAEVISNN